LLISHLINLFGLIPDLVFYKNRKLLPFYLSFEKKYVMERFDRSIWIGLLLGAALPVVGYAVTLMVFEQLAKMGLVQSSMGEFSPTQSRTMWVIGIMFNLIPFQYFKVKRAERAMNGVLMMTIVAVVVWVIYYYKFLF